MSEEERDVQILGLIQRSEDELRVATRSLTFPEDAGALAAFEAGFVAAGHFPASFATALRQAHRLQQVADGRPAVEVPAEKAEVALRNATAFCYTVKDALVKWKQGRALQ
jgi:uncharacterized protein (UPF0332 family)